MIRAAVSRAYRGARAGLANELRASSSLGCTSIAAVGGAVEGASSRVTLLAAQARWIASSQAGSRGVSLPFAARSLSSSAGADKAGKAKEDALSAGEDPFDAITDKIPEKPVGVVEGTSYTIVIVAALGFAAAAGWAILKDLFVTPAEYQVFNKTLEKLQDDPRVIVRLGAPLKGFGADSRNRRARQAIPHQTYSKNGVEHVRVQFQAKGPVSQGTVHADMFYADGDWQYHYLYVDVGQSRVAIVEVPALQTIH